MKDPGEEWFEPRKLFGEEGRYPESISSALRVFPQIFDAIRRLVAEAAPRRALEVGPGDRPAIEDVARPVYLDLVPGFLRGKRGACVLGDVRRAPFRADAFDVVVANDVFTHIPPAERPLVVEELVRLAPRIVIFNPEPGTPEVPDSPVSTDALVAALGRAGYRVERRDYVAHAPKGRYAMAMIAANRQPPRT